MTAAYEVAPPSRAGVELDDGGASRPVGAIITDLWEKTETLVRQEVSLAIATAEDRVDVLKVELDAKVQELKLELFAKAIGGVVAFAGLLTLIAGIVAIFALVMPLWLAALMVGVVFVVGGMLLLNRKLNLLQPPPSLAFGPDGTTVNMQRELHATEETNHDTAK